MSAILSLSQCYAQLFSLLGDFLLSHNYFMLIDMYCNISQTQSQLFLIISYSAKDVVHISCYWNIPFNWCEMYCTP